jgi:hypothetical protein
MERRSTNTTATSRSLIIGANLLHSPNKRSRDLTISQTTQLLHHIVDFEYTFYLCETIMVVLGWHGKRRRIPSSHCSSKVMPSMGPSRDTSTVNHHRFCSRHAGGAKGCSRGERGTLSKITTQNVVCDLDVSTSSYSTAIRHRNRRPTSNYAKPEERPDCRDVKSSVDREMFNDQVTSSYW